MVKPNISAKESLVSKGGSATPYFIRFLQDVVGSIGGDITAVKDGVPGTVLETMNSTEGQDIIRSVSAVPVSEVVPPSSEVDLSGYEKRAPFSKDYLGTGLYYDLAFIDDEVITTGGLTVGAVIDTLYFTPIIIYDDYVINNMCIRSIAAQVGADDKYRLGIYTAQKDTTYGCRPLSLITGSDSGDIGPLVLANTNYAPSTTIPFYLPAGVYFLAWVRGGGATPGNARSFGTTNNSATRAIRQLFQYIKTSGTNNRHLGYSAAITYPAVGSTLPVLFDSLTWSALTANSNFPVPMFKVNS